jgi:hypothetical protein
MSFRPGTTRDLVCPEPHSTTGRAIASLSLRQLNEDFAAFCEEDVGDARSRAAFVAFRREMDALLPGRPKMRVAILASPFVRAPLERSLRRAGDAFFEAASAGLFALQMGPELSRAVAIHDVDSWIEGEITFSAGVASVFGLVASAPSEAEREDVAAALRLLDAAASTELAELPRFFELVVPIERGIERRPGVLGLALDEGPLAIALRVVEALAVEKVERYARLVERDASPWLPATRHVVRREFLRRLAVVRHPIAKAPEALGRLSREDEALSRIVVEEDRDGSLVGLADELARLAQ